MPVSRERARRLVVGSTRRCRVEQVGLKIRMKLAEVVLQSNPSRKLTGAELRSTLRHAVQVVHQRLHFAAVVL